MEGCRGSRTARVQIDFGKSCGTLRRLNGGNLGPRLLGSEEKLIADFASLEIPLTRLHDAPLANRGMRLVDIQHIFGNWKADPGNPDNYYFEQTDEYLRRILEAGSEVMYRLGTSIDHAKPRFYTAVPDDFDKWAEICIHIIRHYNEGWNHGFHWNIRYWEIWNEPDDHNCVNPSPMWAGSAEEYYRLYEVAAKRIKAEFPDLKVGGPSAYALDAVYSGRLEPDFLPDFFAHCRRTGTPLDFFSWHHYSGPRAPFDIIEEPVRARRMLDEAGFPETELHLNEWRYLEKWDQKDYWFGRNPPGGIKAAAHLAGTLIGWQDTPLDMGGFYTVGQGNSTWGLWALNERQKTFYAMKAFAELAHCRTRVASLCDTGNIHVAAAMDTTGNKRILLSDFETACEEISVELKDADPAGFKIYLLDGEHDLEPVLPVVEKGRLILPTLPGGFAVWLLCAGKPLADLPA